MQLKGNRLRLFYLFGVLFLLNGCVKNLTNIKTVYENNFERNETRKHEEQSVTISRDENNIILINLKDSYSEVTFNLEQLLMMKKTPWQLILLRIRYLLNIKIFLLGFKKVIL